MELIGLIILSYGLVILWDYNATLFWVVAMLFVVAGGSAALFALQKKAPNILKSLRRAQKRTPAATPLS